MLLLSLNSNASCVPVDAPEGTIEKAAKNFLQSEVDLTVAGRTDAGVHAEAQVAHLDIFKKLKIKNILFGLNFYLSKEKFGEDISIKKVNKVDTNFNARFGAKKKTYKYKGINFRITILEKTKPFPGLSRVYLVLVSLLL